MKKTGIVLITLTLVMALAVFATGCAQNNPTPSESPTSISMGETEGNEVARGSDPFSGFDINFDNLTLEDLDMRDEEGTFRSAAIDTDGWASVDGR